MEINDCCRFCEKNLRISGVIGHSTNIFLKHKTKENVAERLHNVGVAICDTPAKSKRLCQRCLAFLSRLERVLPVYWKWVEDEKDVEASAAEGRPDKRDREPTPWKTPRDLKKFRPSPASPGELQFDVASPRFPTHHKRRKPWLTALNMNPTTPVVILKNWRVCSEHFTQEDYTSTGLRLKDAATQTILKSRTQQSGSSPNTGESSDGRQNLPEVQNASPQNTSSAEEPMTDFRLPLQRCDHSLVDDMDFLSPPEHQKSGVRSGLMADVVVKVACLLELFQNCFRCYSDACSITTETKGLLFRVVQQCWSCGKTRNWTSHPPDHPDPTASHDTPQESEPSSEDMEEEEEEDDEEDDDDEDEEEEDQEKEKTEAKEEKEGQ